MLTLRAETGLPLAGVGRLNPCGHRQNKFTVDKERGQRFPSPVREFKSIKLHLCALGAPPCRLRHSNKGIRFTG
jgi:hypothetical protein